MHLWKAWLRLTLGSLFHIVFFLTFSELLLVFLLFFFLNFSLLSSRANPLTMRDLLGNGVNVKKLKFLSKWAHVCRYGCHSVCLYGSGRCLHVVHKSGSEFHTSFPYSYYSNPLYPPPLSACKCQLFWPLRLIFTLIIRAERSQRKTENVAKFQRRLGHGVEGVSTQPGVCLLLYLSV